jgi:hypothetical protein
VISVLPAFLRGWHALNTGEVRSLNVVTSGGWLTQFVVGFMKTVCFSWSRTGHVTRTDPL